MREQGALRRRVSFPDPLGVLSCEVPGVEVEDREERGAGKGKERKLWTGLHLGHEIFITCLQERGQRCFRRNSFWTQAAL